MNQQTLFGSIVLGIVGVILVWVIGFNVGTGSVTPTPALPTPTPRTPTPPTPTFTPAPNTPTSTATSTPIPTATFTPTPTPTPTGWFTPGPISAVGKLITAEQTFLAGRYYESQPSWCPFDFCKNKFTIVAYGTVQAGVDLKKMGDKDFVLNDGTITITLPPPEIFGKPSLDLDKTFIIDDSLNPFRVDPNIVIQLESELQDMALEQVLNDGELLEKTIENTEMQIELLLRRSGAKDVTIRWAKRGF